MWFWKLEIQKGWSHYCISYVWNFSKNVILAWTKKVKILNRCLLWRYVLCGWQFLRGCCPFSFSVWTQDITYFSRIGCLEKWHTIFLGFHIFCFIQIWKCQQCKDKVSIVVQPVLSTITFFHSARCNLKKNWFIKFSVNTSKKKIR